MSRDQDQDEAILEDRAQLIEFFRDGITQRDDRKVGTEHEKFGFRRSDSSPMTFDDIEDVLQRMADKFGWIPAHDQGRIVALERDGDAITLEPGGQFELSGGVKKTVFGTRDELDLHFRELTEVAPEFVFVCTGVTPFHGLDEIGWVPKSRYGVMRNYLAPRGEYAHWMMKLTTTIQANFDYTSEEDAASLMRGAYLASPFVAALFANSSVLNGKPNGFQSFRTHIWTAVDPDRTGVPDFMIETGWGFEEYLDYVLDVPMFFIRRPQGYVNMAGHSFRDFWHKGYEGHRATMGDFELHLSTVFPEVRMKQYIEVRSADGGPRSHMLALPALWKGLVYNDDARKSTLDLLGHYTADQLRTYLQRAAKDGIHAQADRPFLEIIKDLVAISRKALDASAIEYGHPSEAVFIEPLEAIIESKRSAADAQLEALEAHPTPARFFESEALF